MQKACFGIRRLSRYVMKWKNKKFRAGRIHYKDKKQIIFLIAQTWCHRIKQGWFLSTIFDKSEQWVHITVIINHGFYVKNHAAKRKAQDQKDQSCSKAPDITGFLWHSCKCIKEVDLVRGRGGSRCVWGLKHYSQISGA